MQRSSLMFIGIFVVALISTTKADVRLPAIFGDHMVLQRDIGVPVWGWADPGEAITVNFADQAVTTQGGRDGKWKVILKSAPGQPIPEMLTVSGKNTIRFQDVLVGDVWLCGGQSNMEFQLVEGEVKSYRGYGHGGASNATAAVAAANDPQMRLFHVKRMTAIEPMTDVEGKWELCDSESVRPFSAIGYFFGKELRQHLHQPIGLIGSYWGGTGITAWTSYAGYEKRASIFPEFSQWKSQREKALAASPAAIAAYTAAKLKYDQDLARWTKDVDQSPQFMKQKAGWESQAKDARAINLPIPARPDPPEPKPVEPVNPQRIPTSSQYNGMIAPLVPYAIKGVIWYQGEAHAGYHNWYRYGDLLAALIGDWRDQWGQGDFPFLIVQLAAYGDRAPANELIQTNDLWPGIREAQLHALSMPNTGLATAVDIGDLYSIHPKDKVDVGQRLALVARHVAYGEDVVYSGPIYSSMKIEGNKIRISFTSIGGGLQIAAPPWNARPESIVKADELQGFAIAGADKHFVWAKATIDGNDVIVWSDQVPSPMAVRYGWANYPYVNLYNKEMLPAVPFRTDRW